MWVLDKGAEMAKFYNVKRNEVIWSDNDLFVPVEDAYFELGEFLATKKLNGHDEKDQWYMLVYQKIKELMRALEENPITVDLGSDKELL